MNHRYTNAGFQMVKVIDNHNFNSVSVNDVNVETNHNNKATLFQRAKSEAAAVTEMNR